MEQHAIQNESVRVAIEEASKLPEGQEKAEALREAEKLQNAIHIRRIIADKITN